MSDLSITTNRKVDLLEVSREDKSGRDSDKMP